MEIVLKRVVNLVVMGISREVALMGVGVGVPLVLVVEGGWFRARNAVDDDLRNINPSARAELAKLR